MTSCFTAINRLTAFNWVSFQRPEGAFSVLWRFAVGAIAAFCGLARCDGFGSVRPQAGRRFKCGGWMQRQELVCSRGFSSSRKLLKNGFIFFSLRLDPRDT